MIPSMVEEQLLRSRSQRLDRSRRMICGFKEVFPFGNPSGKQFSFRSSTVRGQKKNLMDPMRNESCGRGWTQTAETVGKSTDQSRNRIMDTLEKSFFQTSVYNCKGQKCRDLEQNFCRLRAAHIVYVVTAFGSNLKIKAGFSCK